MTTGAVHAAATSLPRPGRWAVLAATALLGAGLVGILVGPADLPPGSVLRELMAWVPGMDTSGLSEAEATILWQIRLPRVVLGALVGAALSVSGAAYQGVFRNPLADPYLLGAAAGAGLGATVTIAFGLRADGVALPAAAFLGATVGVVAAYVLGRASGRSSSAMILAGVAVSAFLTAAQTSIQQRHADTLREVYAWILGQLTTAGWGDVGRVWPVVVGTAIVIVLHGRLLDVLRVGIDESESVGVDTGRVRLVVVAAATLATAAAVAVSGLIGFVGIIVPHTIRLLVGPSYRRILPLSVAGGAAFLVLADVVARSALRPQELPIGVVTAFLGAPFFTLVLRSRREGSS